VDQDGATSYSSRVEVDFAGSNLKPSLICVPNPTHTGQIHLRILNSQGKEMTVQLTDLRGTVILRETVQVTDDVQSIALDPTLRLASGMYIASAECAGETLHVRVVVR
jgi:hypothetical protein